MLRTLSLLLLVVTAVGVVATPGLAAVGLLLAPLAVLVALWWIALGAATDHRRTDAVARVRHRELMGPGGPDDPFAGERDRVD
jgi:uncharacterized membrane protein YozB (DUF420 family)